MVEQTFWQRLRGDLWFVAKRIAVYEAAIIVVTLVICLWRGYTTTNEISLAMLAIGAIVFCIGPFSMMGGWGTTRNFQYLYGQSMNPDKIDERARQDNQDMRRNMGVMLPSILLGTLTIIIAVIVQTVGAAM